MWVVLLFSLWNLQLLSAIQIPHSQQFELPSKLSTNTVKDLKNSPEHYITDHLKGTLLTSQYNENRTNSFVESNEKVHHKIFFNDNDKKFLINNVYEVTTYWFVDCNYVGSTNGYSMDWTYNDKMEEHRVTAVLTIPKKITTTTLKLTTTTIPKKEITTTTKITTTILKPTTTSKQTTITILKPTTTEIPKTTTKIPKSTTTEATTTLKPNTKVYNEVLTVDNDYNKELTNYMTNQVRRKREAKSDILCDRVPGEIPKNHVIYGIFETVVKVKRSSVHPQLSVIVVPVVFCVIAVIFVVLGIAYYQHRSRHTVEVADFDFGQNYPEFKTFPQRVRDSLANVFHFGNQSDTEPLTTNSREDSMP